MQLRCGGKFNNRFIADLS